MKILVTAKYVSGAATEGGSSRFMKCVIDTLEAMGHDVIATPAPKQYINEEFDYIICSHLLNEIKDNPSKKIYISHGIIGHERFYHGADRYISVSQEVYDAQLKRGFPSEVIPQPISIPDHSCPGKELKKILIIRRESVDEDPFTFLKGKYDVRYSDLNIPIEQQIKWADLSITLGRGALESMAHGRPVLVADNRPYIGNYGDGYVSPENIHEIAKCNFSGRRFKHEVTQDWIENELAKYNQDHSIYLHNYVKEKHKAEKIINQYINFESKLNMAFGALVNDPYRLDMVLRQSEIDGEIVFMREPESATTGLNQLLDLIDEKDYQVAALVHQDMFFRTGWAQIVKAKLEELPKDWIIAGIIGKDMKGRICGRLHDMRMPLIFNSDHSFPVRASCLDECCIFINLKSRFRFDTRLTGFDLYGTLAILQAEEMGGSCWIIDAFAEHFCMRPFPWRPEKDFFERVEWIKKEFPNAKIIDSTAFGRDGKIFNPGGIKPENKEEVIEKWPQSVVETHV